jgi:cytochrome P450
MEELTLSAWSEILLGIGSDRPEFPEVRTLFSELWTYNPRPPTDTEVDAKLDRLADLVREGHDRAANGWAGARTGPLSLASEFVRIQPDALEQPAIVRNLIYTAMTARDDVAGLLMWLFKNLSDNPAWVTELRAAPAHAPDLTARIVSETLRLGQSEYLQRRARREIRFRDIVIPAGWIVRVCIREIHRDGTTFRDAERFDPTRFVDGGCGREVYSPFGIDQRACVGESLSRTIAGVFVTELVEGFEWETTADGPPELSRQRHWAPSSSWRVSITRRVAAGAEWEHSASRAGA